MKKTGIVSVAFNNSKLIFYQIKLFKKYCKDDYDINIIDNSNNIQELKKIKEICVENNVSYFAPNINVTDASNHHGLALNYAYNSLKNNFDYLLFIDHDVFPIKEFSVEAILGDNVMAGFEIIQNNVMYLWPGFLILSKIDENFDFTPITNLDTGGKLNKFVGSNKEKILIIKQKTVPLDIKTNNELMHEFYADIYDGTFMHFIKASNWCKVEDQIFNLRQNYLFNILDKHL